MKRYLLTALIALSIAGASAQTPDAELYVRGLSSGNLLNRDVMSIADMGIFAQSPFQYGTARSMGLAGAMTSLGGDATSMMINPAGLGMARSSDITITPMLTIQSATTDGADPYRNNGRTPFALSNFSATIKLYESGSTGLVSLNMGLGYNRIADLNYGYSFASMNNDSSIARLFSRQLTDSGVSISELYGSSKPNWNSLSTNLWSAALAYKSGLTFQSVGSLPYSDYNTDNPNSQIIESGGSPIWSSTWISDDASVNQYASVESDGSIGEFDIAFGANINNTLYLGFTLGIQTVYQRLDLLYGEQYDNQEALSGENQLYYSNYNQAIITDGSGVNVKLGATYRPADNLRIGVAYHSPTYYTLSRQYQASMASSSNYDGSNEFYSADSPLLEDYNENNWNFRTASRVLIGASYMFGQRGLISVDYQRDWYGSMKMTSAPTGVSLDTYSNLSQMYQSVNTIRIGAEAKLSPMAVLRGGYGFSSSMVRDNIDPTLLWGQQTTDNIKFYSAGIGFSPTRNVTFDFTYMCQTTETNEYSLFYSTGDISGDFGAYESMIPSAESAQSRSFKSTIKQHNIALSMVLKM